MRAASVAQPRVSRSAVARPAARYGPLLAALILAGGLVRFITLGGQSLWLDEAFTHTIVSHGLGHVFSSVLSSNHGETEATPPLYYVLLWVWTRLFGTHDVALRALSAACGTLTIPVMAALGRRLLSERVGLIAALLTATNPLLVWYSQEARAYALLVLLSALSLWALLWVLERPSGRRLVVWGLVCAAGLATHYFAIFIIVPEAAWLLAALRNRREVARSEVAMGFAPLVGVAIALAPVVIHQTPQANWIVQSPLGNRVVLLAAQDILGYGGSRLLAVIGLCLVATSLVLLLRRGDDHERAAVGLPLLIGGVGAGLPILLALLGADYLDTRNLLVTWPALGLVVAVGFGVAQPRRIGTLAAAGFAVIGIGCVASVVGNVRFQRSDWRGMASVLGPAAIPRAIVSYDIAGPSLAPYLPKLTGYPSKGTRISEIDVVSPLQTQWLGTSAQRLRTATPPPGFAPAQRIQSDTYLILRYRSQVPRHPEPAALRRLYPNLRAAAVLLQLPRRAASLGR